MSNNELRNYYQIKSYNLKNSHKMYDLNIKLYDKYTIKFKHINVNTCQKSYHLVMIKIILFPTNSVQSLFSFLFLLYFSTYLTFFCFFFCCILCFSAEGTFLILLWISKILRRRSLGISMADNDIRHRDHCY